MPYAYAVGWSGHFKPDDALQFDCWLHLARAIRSFLLPGLRLSQMAVLLDAG